MQFDHLMHWVPDLEPALAECAARGFPARMGGDIGGSPLRNATWSGRDLQYVELISVRDWDDWRSRPRGPVGAARDAAMADGGGALQFAFEVDDLASAVVAARGRGVAFRDPEAGSWRSASGTGTATWEAAWLAEGPGWRPFFIRYPAPRAERLARAREQGRRLLDFAFDRIVLETPDPEASAAWLGRVIGVPAGVVDGAPSVEAFGCSVRFAPGARDRVVGVGLDGTEGPTGELLGVTYACGGDR
jgi:Glyoxalase-like domain